MKVLGIDPGSTVTGWGVVAWERGRYVPVAWGSVKTSSDEEMASRLVKIHQELVTALATHHPDQVAIEAIFKHKSAESAIRLGQARGVALLAVGQAGYAPHEYNNSTVKASVGAHGRADKEGVARMVTLLLGVTPDGPADVTDALAIAITHLAHARVQAMARRVG